ncbi:MAG: hypothetical protein R3B99_23580 [Polyangiales bacterium]
MFWTRPFLPAADVDALLDVCRWVFSHVYGGVDAWKREAKVIEPLPENFPVDTALEGDERVEDYLAFVKEHAGMSELMTEVVPAGSPSAVSVRVWKHEAVRDDDAPPEVRSWGASSSSRWPASVLPQGSNLPIPNLEIAYAPDLIAYLARLVVGWRVALVDDGSFEGGTPSDVAVILAGFGVFYLDASCHRVEVDRSRNLMVTRPSMRLSHLDTNQLAFVVATMDALLNRRAGSTTRYLSADASRAYAAARKLVARLDLRALDDRP